MAEKLLKTDVPYEPGFLYFCKREKDDTLAVYRAKMARGGRRKKGRK